MSNRVKVVCRVRPTLSFSPDGILLNNHQLPEEEQDCVSILGSNASSGATHSGTNANGNEISAADGDKIRFIDTGQTFTVDQVFSTQCTQEQMFLTVALPLVKEAFLGFNCTLFSYGQTGKS
jgi:hypothetical protein